MTEAESGIATLPHVDDTVALGSQLGGQLRAGDVVVLSGPLGAGKTVLAKGIAAAMDVDGPVTSPTFVLARVHPARPSVSLHPNRSEDSIPIITASLPARITARACAGL